VKIENQLTDILKARASGVFLFLGSGFSRRYLGLEDWEGLLRKFCVVGKSFEYYFSSAEGCLPTVAQLLSVDFHDEWWKNPLYKAENKKDLYKLCDKTSALRIEICEYLGKIDDSSLDKNYEEEIEILRELDVDGIITTNWDQLSEYFFPEHKVYIGQNELLVSSPQGIAEIYKIHGCCSNPQSLVLTKKDYQNFSQKNAYLASKLITIFMEHPIIFIGYSLADENIQAILKEISLCIEEIDLKKLKRNLIFIQRLKNEDKPNVSEAYITIDGISIPIILVKTNNFREVYSAIKQKKRKIPTRTLRYCKEQLYEIAQSCVPEKKICVLDIDAIENKKDIEFVVGVGVARKKQEEIKGISELGYVSIKSEDIFYDLIYQDKNYNPDKILNSVMSDIGRNITYLPLFHYLNKLGIKSKNDYEKSNLKLDKWIILKIETLRQKSYEKSFSKHCMNKNLKEIIDSFEPQTAAKYIPFLPVDDINLDALWNFLVKNEHHFISSKSNHATCFRKIACLYDKIKYGW